MTMTVPPALSRDTKMWLVAIRQHRGHLALVLGLMAAVAACIIWYRSELVSVWQQRGCEFLPQAGAEANCAEGDRGELWWNHFQMPHMYLQQLVMASPAVFGALAAAPIFTREFGHRTHIFALTQSVSRRRWFITKTLAMLLPTTGGLLALGFLMQWADETVSETAFWSMQPSTFLTRSIVPAALGLVSFGLALFIGMVTRNVVAALVPAVILSGVVMFGAVAILPHVLPAERLITPLSDVYPHYTAQQWDALQSSDPGEIEDTPAESAWLYDPNTRWLRDGRLGPDGRPVERETSPQSDAAWGQCYTRADDAAVQTALGAGLIPDPSVLDHLDDGQMDDDVDLSFLESRVYQNSYNATYVNCMADIGVVANYSDYYPAAMTTPLRLTMSGILAALAALWIALSAYLLPQAVSQR